MSKIQEVIDYLSRFHGGAMEPQIKKLKEVQKHPRRCPKCEAKQRRGVCMEHHFDETNGDD